MRFLGVGDYCDLASLYLRLAAEGHEVKVSIAEPMCRSTLAGMIDRVDDWREHLNWIREVGRDGVILFENVGGQSGAYQDRLRSDGYQVIGGSAFGDRLENERGFAQTVMKSLGLQVAPVYEFETVADAASFLKERPGRYVLKFNGGEEFGAADNYVGRFPDGRDVLALIKAKFSQLGRDRIAFVLMEFIAGVEMGVGAYFDGGKFLMPACLDWEHKRFFPGDIGELTGEMGTVVTYDGSRKFFDMTLGRAASILKDNKYCGYINLNTIVNESGIWPLEFTCRFGYPGYSILEPLQKTSWASLFKKMLSGLDHTFEAQPGFCLGIVLTTRPFPYVRTQVLEPVGLPIMFEGSLSKVDEANLHFCEVGMIDDQLVTAGYHGWTMVATGSGNTISEAQRNAYELADRVVIPNMRFRNDIGVKLAESEYAFLKSLALIGDS